ncbi:MAG: anaerobic ribonucleoside-triphosphate reductase activating protein [Puniceicoccales bacterium]|jgi:pyruvate formate lyase activating enzyme|nr:anaerobic ribonucleoside-triphosphate reductase activating protein [Puniceicoccales bacterium]
MMIIGGWEKCSLIDFPGKIATILFTQGCVFRCPFCHNGELLPPLCEAPISTDTIFQFLERRIGQIEGVVISGGEPTLQRGLPDFLRRIRKLGFATKLDTNGICPSVLSALLSENLLDYVAIDIKHTPQKYSKACGTEVHWDAIAESIGIIRQSTIDYELRTTVVPGLHAAEDLKNLVPLVDGVRRFTLQNFVPDHAFDGAFRKIKPFPGEFLEQFRPVFTPIVGIFSIR